MKILRAVRFEDYRRDVFCHACGSQLEITAPDVDAINVCKDAESPPEWHYGFTCVVCREVCILADRPLPPYVREAAERRAREPQQEANGDATQDG